METKETRSNSSILNGIAHHVWARVALLEINDFITVLEVVFLVGLVYYASYGFLSRHFPTATSILIEKLNMQKEDNYVLPKKVFLVRHGQSLGNITEVAYETTPDWRMPLTKQGKQEAMQAGLQIKEECGDTPVVVYYSPYKRTKETMKQILRAFPSSQIYIVQEEPRIREQDFGNFQNNKRMQLCKRERLSFSRFFYRFPSGESGADVYDRVSSFMVSLFRLFHRENKREFNLIIVSHGLTIRIILMRWFRWTVQEFETLVNPKNAFPIVMERRVEGKVRKYRLTAKSWNMLHDYKELSKRALRIRRPRRRRSRTLITLQELMQSDNEVDDDIEVVRTRKSPSSSLSTIKEHHSSLDSEETLKGHEEETREGNLLTNEDIAESFEQGKEVFRNQEKLKKLIRRTSAREGPSTTVDDPSKLNNLPGNQDKSKHTQIKYIK